jgi:signal transduction histidine kinase
VKELKPALIGLAAAAVLAGVVSAALALASDHVTKPWLTIALGLFIGWSFVGTGLYAWARRPTNRFGALLAAVGFAFFLGSLTASDASVVFTIGVLLSNAYLAVFAHLLLAYPDGRLRHRGHRGLVAFAYALSVVGPLPALLFGSAEQFDCDCPRSAVLIARDDTMLHVTDALTSAVAVAFVFVLLALIVRRWRSETPARRRTLAPMLWSGVALLVILAGSLTSEAVRISPRLTDALGGLGLIVFASVPFAFLAGLLRTRVARAGAVSDLLMRLGEAPGTGGLRDLLANALGDPSLQLVYWLEDRGGWVDAAGHETALPGEGDRARACTPVEHDGRRVGAVVHDRSLLEDPDLVRSVAVAAGLAVENERLQARLHARVEDLRTSRARLVEAGTAERRRLERNLHDGAQQRLVALSLTMRLAQARIHEDPAKAEELLVGARHELTLALAELRELARGIHPAVLSDRGLRAALEGLAGRSPVPVELRELPVDPLPQPIEAAAYFVVAEALTNVAKYAGATQAVVRVARHNGTAVVEVADDGVGGADPGRGSGLRGLLDRVAALDGSMRVMSPPGEGTRLRAEMPV